MQPSQTGDFWGDESYQWYNWTTWISLTLQTSKSVLQQSFYSWSSIHTQTMHITSMSGITVVGHQYVQSTAICKFLSNCHVVWQVLLCSKSNVLRTIGVQPQPSQLGLLGINLKLSSLLLLFYIRNHQVNLVHLPWMMKKWRVVTLFLWYDTSPQKCPIYTCTVVLIVASFISTYNLYPAIASSSKKWSGSLHLAMSCMLKRSSVVTLVLLSLVPAFQCCMRKTSPVFSCNVEKLGGAWD